MTLLGYTADEHNYYASDAERLLRKLNIVDFMDFVDVSSTPYDRYPQLLGEVTMQQSLDIIIDSRLLVQYLYELANFETIFQQNDQDLAATWNKIMDDETNHKRRFQ